MSSAALIIIGNEVLSGRTQDANTSFLADELNKLGIRLHEVRIVLDIEADIIAAVQALSPKYTYIFTTGGIGPTHDDITTAAIAKAFNKKVIRHPEAVSRLTTHYQSSALNEARLKMADIPESADLIDNPLSSAPGFILENVYVMAGVPKIMQAMFDGLKAKLKGGAPMITRGIRTSLTESMIAAELSVIQQHHLRVEIGSYPSFRPGELSLSLLVRGTSLEMIEAATLDIINMIQSKNGQCERIDG